MDLQYPKLNLRHLNQTDDNDLSFTYSLLKKRFEAKTKINIKEYKLPTYQEHVTMLQSDRFMYYYFVSYGEVEFMTLYVISGSNELGFFIDPEKWEQVIRNNKEQLVPLIADMSNCSSISKKMAAYIVKLAVEELLDKHEELKTSIRAKVSSENMFSQFVAHQQTKYGKFEPHSIRYKLCPELINWDLNSEYHNIRPLDISNADDIAFTYELLKMRFNLEHINIRSDTMPTLEQHLDILRSNRYKYYYICSYKEIDLLAMYVINEGPELGAFINPQNLFQVIKKYTDKEYWQNIALMPKNISKSWKVSAHHGQAFLNKLLKLHPELVDTLESTVNVKNEWSKVNTEALGFKPLYTMYEYSLQH